MFTMRWKCERNEKNISVFVEVDQGTFEEEKRMSVRFTICNAFFSINHHNISVMFIFNGVDYTTIFHKICSDANK